MEHGCLMLLMFAWSQNWQSRAGIGAVQQRKLSSLTSTQNKHVSNVVEAADSLLRAIKEVASSACTLRMLSSEERSSWVSTSLCMRRRMCSNP